MKNNKHSIQSTQMATFLMSAQIGFGIITLSSTLAASVGHDGWISVLAAGIVSIICTYLISIFLKRYSNKSIFQINPLLYGKYLGLLLNLMIFLYLLFICAVIFRLFSEIIKITVLKLTPLPAISLATSFTAVYITFKGLKVVSRFTATLLVTYILTIIFYLMIFRFGRITFIMPVGNAGIKAIIYGMYLSSFAYLGIELLPIIYPYITDKQNVTKYAIIGNAFTVILFTTIVFISTEYIGEWKLKLLAFPLFNIATSVRIPIIERLDLLFVMFWFPVMGSSIRSYFFCAYHSLDLVFSIKDKKYPIVLFIIIIGFIGNIPKDLLDLYSYVDLLGLVGLIVNGFYIFSLLFSFINKRGVKIENNENS